jgi:hypothetical protein
MARQAGERGIASKDRDAPEPVLRPDRTKGGATCTR